MSKKGAKGTNWFDFANTNTTFTSGILTQTTQYRAVVQIGICPAYSGSTTVTVSPMTIGGSVSGGTNICTGSTSGTLLLSGETGSITKWQYSTNGTSWTDITNTSNTYTSSGLVNTTQYRAQIQSGACASAFSSSTTVTVDAANNGGALNGGASICSGNISPTLSLSGNAGNISKWQSSINGGTNWTDIVNTA